MTRINSLQRIYAERVDHALGARLLPKGFALGRPIGLAVIGTATTRGGRAQTVLRRYDSLRSERLAERVERDVAARKRGAL